MERIPRRRFNHRHRHCKRIQQAQIVDAPSSHTFLHWLKRRLYCLKPVNNPDYTPISPLIS